MKDNLIDAALLSVAFVGYAAGRVANWAAEKVLRDNQQQNAIELARALARIERQSAEIRVLRRSMAMCCAHPAAPSVQMRVAGGDDPTLAGLRRKP